MYIEFIRNDIACICEHSLILAVFEGRGGEVRGEGNNYCSKDHLSDQIEVSRLPVSVPGLEINSRT